MQLLLLRAAAKRVPGYRRFLLPVFNRFRGMFPSLENRERERFRTILQGLPEHVAQPIFVKVGANDGVSGDECSDILLSDARWHGLLIEPVPYLFGLLRKTFADGDRFLLEQKAIGPGPGLQSFFYVDPEALRHDPSLPPWSAQISSLNREHVARELGPAGGFFIKELIVPVEPLSALLSRHGLCDVHFLHVDTEGYDYEVLKTLDFSTHKPLLILVEHRHLNLRTKRKMLSLLRMHAYRVSDCGHDYVALHSTVA